MHLKDLRKLSNAFQEHLRNLEDVEMNRPGDPMQLHRAYDNLELATHSLECSAMAELDNLMDIAEAAHELTLVGHTEESYYVAHSNLLRALSKMGAGPTGDIA